MYKKINILLLALLLSIIVALWNNAVHYDNYEVPSPPIGANSISDTFMDKYNTDFHTARDDRYWGWQSVYLPFTFILSNLTEREACIFLTPINLRACDEFYGVFILSFFILISIVISSILICSQLELKRVHVAAFIVVLSFSMPTIFVLERGNYLVFALLFISIGTRLKNRIANAIFYALAINVKHYLILPYYLYCLKKDKYYTFLLSLMFFIIFSATVFTTEAYDVLLVFSNMLNFNSSSTFSIYEKIWMPTSLFAYIKSVELIANSVNGIEIGAHVELLFVTFRVFMLGFAFLFISLLLSKNKSPMMVLLGGIILLLIMFDSVGGYGIILIYPFIGLILKLNSWSVIWSLFVLLSPFDPILFPSKLNFGISFITSNFVFYESTITVFSYCRPLALIVIAFKLFKNFNISDRRV